MVGADIALIAVLARSPGGEPTDVPLSRGAISEAVAYHVRTTDPRVHAWIQTGAAESQTFRDLLNLLASSDVIVHVQLVDHLTTAGQLYFVTATSTVRYVRIEVVVAGNAHEMIALIGHELQHAVEVANQPQIRDRRGLSLFYRTIAGNSSERTDYDSVAARVVEERVRREMAGAPAADSHSSPAQVVAVKAKRN